MESREPVFGSEAFDCPICGVYAHQRWASVSATRAGGGYGLNRASVSECQKCTQDTLWWDEAIIFPTGLRVGTPPIDGLPENVRDVYEEARDVAARSPRSALALLRLALQMLVEDLEPEAANLNDAIGRLVSRGLADEVRQAMDVIRVVGNNAVHPGQIAVDDDPSLVPAMFGLINLIFEQVVVRKQTIAALYGTLPEGALTAIARRDGERGA